jgi:phage-related protein
VPFITWFDRLQYKVQDKCTVRLERLAEEGHLLRRPEADYLGDGIYELRARHGGIRYRILYFYHGRNVAVISHGFLKKQAKVPVCEIRKAHSRKTVFERHAARHTCEVECPW